MKLEDGTMSQGMQLSSSSKGKGKYPYLSPGQDSHPATTLISPSETYLISQLPLLALKIIRNLLGMVSHAFNTSTQKSETGRSLSSVYTEKPSLDK